MEEIIKQVPAEVALAVTSATVLGTLFLLHRFLATVGALSTRLGPWWRRYVWSWQGLFWLVNGVCMVFSAQNAGYLFGIYEPLSGWAVGLVLDLLIIVFTQSMLHALARGERGRATQILSFIFACTLISFLGNLAHNLHVPSGDAFTGVWFGVLLPYAASNMPFFLVALAWASDLKGNPLETMDLQEYEALERKQANFLRVQVEQRELRAALETRLIAIEQMERQNKRLRRKKLPKTFRWFWEKPADLEAVIATVAMQLKTMFDADLPPRDEQQQVQVGQLPVAREMPSPTTDLSSSRQKQASGHQACGRVPNGLTSDLFEGDQEPTSLPIMYVHSIPHTVRFPAKKNECQGVEKGGDHHWNDSRGKDEKMLRGTKR